jgi:hypothetical protein
MQTKAILKTEAVNQYIDLHKNLKIPFTLTLSTYTARIKSNYCDIYFMKSEQPNRVFCAYNKVKKDVTTQQVKKIKVNSLQYYSTNFKDDNFYSDVIYNVDIKSAYATILYNDGLIKKETFEYLCKLPKMERLASVGMLAGKKNIFEMDADGEVISEKTEISPTADYFFYCVKRTSEIINFVSKHLGNAFLFSWVDGIYFLQANHKGAMQSGEIVKDYFAEINLKASFDVLREFEVIGQPDYYNCNFIKEDKRKFINVPRPNNRILNQITEHLLTKTYNND